MQSSGLDCAVIQATKLLPDKKAADLVIDRKVTVTKVYVCL